MSKVTHTFDSVYNKAKELNKTPRYHGNGFVQIDLDFGRLNVWPDQRVSCQKVNTQIHNHRFSFNSRVIAGNGKLIHKVYAPYFHSEGKMQLYTAVPSGGENTFLHGTGDFCDMIIQSECRIWNEYSFSKGLYHETVTDGLVMTLMVKTENDKSIVPSIACKRNLNPDNDFNRHSTVSSSDCWDIIRAAFEEVHEHWVNPYK